MGAHPVALAPDPARLQQVKDRLAWNRLSASLFDTRLYTRNLEAAFSKMVRRRQEGLPPDHIFIG
ncbi:MAG: hypothetical protein MUF16_22370 [Burkholderiaceae bacterium]|jgi:predicted O-linked N-acetylglucosamine transferase (SPINDLY family)|nr:hypothetical protein [Burkholderiaceae bacterium]